MREEARMDEQQARDESLALVERSQICMLATNSDEGHPHIKAVIKAEAEGLQRVWISTNTSSRRVAQLGRDPRASVYFVDFDKWMGLMLVGEVELLQDAASRRRLWHEGDERYYPLGVDDPDYTVLRFTASWGNFYHSLSTATFDV
jgi:general stress protein 26